ncbi:putative RNA-directed DNA polymerase, partial [Tanacetum coccineum]
MLKKPFRKLLHDQGNLHEKVNRLRTELDEVQKALDVNPADNNLRDEECAYVQAFNEAKIDEERFLKQKAKADWLATGDSNSAYFHKSIKCRNQRSRIESILNSENQQVSGSLVHEVFISHYEQFLGSSTNCQSLNMEGLFSKSVSVINATNMIRVVTNKEIKATMFDIGDDKAPGPDGFTSVFYKNGWDIVGHEVCNAVSTPSRVNDFRPISCCNVIYKCISKIITNRIIDGIKEVVSDNQSAFISGRRISDNILITQELVHNYHRNRGPARCAFKIDIQKAYGKRGLGQGDLLSPYLFTLVMEILTLILKRRIGLSNSFKYHRYCEDIQLINVCFADDLFIFAHGDLESSRVIMDSLEEFKNSSGLVPSIPKSTTYFCNVLDHTKATILNIMPFSKGDLPVKYLGIPLISSGLLNRDCKVLVEKAKNKIGDWKNKSLSFAGRLQSCKSVISSMHVYWASVLIIPKGIIYDIHQLIRGFLWCNGELKRGKAKIAWEDICRPTREGGLGIRNLEVFNYALMTTHIWNILSSKESLWVRWIHKYKLRGRTFWDIPVKNEMSWGWRKLLQLRDVMPPFFWVTLGNGMSTSIWYDKWCMAAPLCNYLSHRDISREGFNLTTKVADLIANGTWSWPHAWLHKAPVLNSIPIPVLDLLGANVNHWRDRNGTLSLFSVAKAWEAIRPRSMQ